MTEVRRSICLAPALALCFAAVVSAETGKPQTVGRVRKVPLATCQVAPE